MLSGRILVEDSTCIIGILDSSLVWGKLAVDPNQVGNCWTCHPPKGHSCQKNQVVPALVGYLDKIPTPKSPSAQRPILESPSFFPQKGVMIQCPCPFVVGQAPVPVGTFLRRVKRLLHIKIPTLPLRASAAFPKIPVTKVHPAKLDPFLVATFAVHPSTRSCSEPVPRFPLRKYSAGHLRIFEDKQAAGHCFRKFFLHHMRH